MFDPIGSAQHGTETHRELTSLRSELAQALEATTPDRYLLSGALRRLDALLARAATRPTPKPRDTTPSVYPASIRPRGLFAG
jgi:hypothetical protein